MADYLEHWFGSHHLMTFLLTEILYICDNVFQRYFIHSQPAVDSAPYILSVFYLIKINIGRKGVINVLISIHVGMIITF